MINVFIQNIEEISSEMYNLFFLKLPKDMQEEVLRYSLIEDRQRTLAGKMLLLDYLKKHTDFTLYDIKKTEYFKPYVKDSNIQFNISHSGKYVICAFSFSETIGIDIEKISEKICIDDFKEVLLQEELQKIKESSNSKKSFYITWTQKEAVLKSVGKGFLDDVKAMKIVENLIFFKHKKYFTSSYHFDNYIFSIVSSKKEEIKIVHLSKKKELSINMLL